MSRGLQKSQRQTQSSQASSRGQKRCSQGAGSQKTGKGCGGNKERPHKRPRYDLCAYSQCFQHICICHRRSTVAWSSSKSDEEENRQKEQEDEEEQPEEDGDGQNGEDEVSVRYLIHHLKSRKSLDL